jgi:prophage regulatory protein
MQIRPNDSPTILRLPAVKSKTGWSRSSIYSLMAQGKFPKAVALGARAIGWNCIEIDDYIASRIAASRGGAQ